MKFRLDVGHMERHTIDFNFNQLLGRTVIKLDGKQIFRKERWFSEPVVDAYDCIVSGRENIHLRIEKERKWLVASKYKVFVDNRLTQLYQGA